MIRIVLAWDLSTAAQVRDLVMILIFLFYCVPFHHDSIKTSMWLQCCIGNPTRGVFERAVAAAEKAKYWYDHVTVNSECQLFAIF